MIKYKKEHFIIDKEAYVCRRNYNLFVAMCARIQDKQAPYISAINILILTQCNLGAFLSL